MVSLTVERLKELIHYNPETGAFTWRVRTNYRLKPGDTAGRSPTRKGYLRIQIDGKRYAAHHLAWFYAHGVWPSARIDHKDRVPGDNRLSGLRPATDAQNRINARLNKNNTSGHKGVSWNKDRQRWHAFIRGQVRRENLGFFFRLEDAVRARRERESALYGEFAGATWR